MSWGSSCMHQAQQQQERRMRRRKCRQMRSICSEGLDSRQLAAVGCSDWADIDVGGGGGMQRLGGAELSEHLVAELGDHQQLCGHALWDLSVDGAKEAVTEGVSRGEGATHAARQPCRPQHEGNCKRVRFGLRARP